MDRTLETLPLIDALGKRQDIAIDVYPYVAGSTVLREWGGDQKEASRRLQPGGACYFQMKEGDVEPHRSPAHHDRHRRTAA